MTLGRAIPLWQEGVRFDESTLRGTVEGVVEVDVVIVGGGYTGLWTAALKTFQAPSDS